MSHNGPYYRKKLPKKPPPGCGKLENFGFGKQVLQCEHSPSKLWRSSSSEDVTDFGKQDKVQGSGSTRPDTNSVAESTRPRVNSAGSPQMAQSQVSESLINKDETAIQTEKPSIEVVETKPPVSLSCLSKQYSLCQESPAPAKFDGRRFASLKYEQMFNWVYFSCSKNGYMCKICELFSPENDGQGQTEYIDKGAVLGDHPGRRLSKHTESLRHKTAALRYTQFTCNTNVYRQIKSHEQGDIERNREVIKKLHRCLYFLIRQKWAASENFEQFVKFVADLGVEDLARHLESIPKSSQANSDNTRDKVTYLSSKSVSQMLENLGEVVERHCLASLGNKKFALLADESTDKANRSQLAIYLRWNDNGAVSDHFMGLVEMG